MKVQTTADLIEEMLGNVVYNDNELTTKLYTFKCRVGCVRARPPRHEYFEFLRETGYVQIIDLFNNVPIEREVLTFVFPERHMSVHECHQFMSKICDNPGVSNIKRLDLITSSPMLITNFSAEQVRVLRWADDREGDDV